VGLGMFPAEKKAEKLLSRGKNAPAARFRKQGAPRLTNVLVVKRSLKGGLGDFLIGGGSPATSYI